MDFIEASEYAEFADALFQDELVRQFGKSEAGDMRYCTAEHDYRTHVAALEFERATHVMRSLAPHRLKTEGTHHEVY